MQMHVFFKKLNSEKKKSPTCNRNRNRHVCREKLPAIEPSAPTWPPQSQKVKAYEGARGVLLAHVTAGSCAFVEFYRSS
jgi:hypothetical protein